jgi:hypothetical protein
MLKEISSMLYRLPAASSPEFAEQFEDSWGGVLLTSLYTEILKGAGDMQEVFSLPYPARHHTIDLVLSMNLNSLQYPLSPCL